VIAPLIPIATLVRLFHCQADGIENDLDIGGIDLAASNNATEGRFRAEGVQTSLC
jgi:hypothetical protein